MDRQIFIVLLIVMSLAVSTGPGKTQDHTPIAASDNDAQAGNFIRSPRLGITHISLAEEPTGNERYEKALALGAGWNRWPLYWDRVQPAARQWRWEAYDRLVEADLRNGLQINAILLGRPRFAQEGDIIKGLHEPIYDDGTDLPGPGKALNPDHYWARFVSVAVNRYKPGGVLATANDWEAGEGIRVWEIWNEPDFESFWQGSIRDYARLLKVAYIVGKQADPDAKIMFGGLLFAEDDNWLAHVLAIYENDPLREENNWYMDQVAVHSYSYPWRSGWLTLWVRQTLSAYNLRRPIWLNESGVRVWDDYPGPLWASDQPDLRVQRATAVQQASYFIQSSVYAWAEGADVVFFHQLFDDCGDQPAGTDFPYSRIGLCEGDALCFGDAYGLYRNYNSALCFSHHPDPGTARPAASAYRLLAEVFGTEPFEKPRQMRQMNNRVQVIAFERPQTSERVYVIWNRTFETLTFNLPATSDHARLFALDQLANIAPNDNRVYPIKLHPAQPDNYPKLEPGDVSAIGGPPVIVVEGSPNLNIVPLFLLPPTPTPTPSPTPEVTPTPE